MSDSKLGVLGCIDHAASEGFDGIEFVEGGWQKEWLNPEGAKKIREHCAEKGIEPVAFLIGADVINWGGDDGREEIQRICRLIDSAAELGVKLFRHDVSVFLPISSSDAALTAFFRRLRRECERSQSTRSRRASAR